MSDAIRESTQIPESNAKSQDPSSPTVILQTATNAIIALEGIIRCDINSVRTFALHDLPLFICYTPPARCLCRVFDPLHRWKVVVILFHGDHPWHIVEGHGLESEVYK